MPKHQGFKYKFLNLLVVFMQIATLAMTASLAIIQPTPEVAQMATEKLGLSQAFAARVSYLTQAAQPLFGTPKVARAAAEGLELVYQTTGTPFTLVGAAKGSTTDPYTISIAKPAGVTNVHKAFAITSDGFGSANGSITINSATPAWSTPACVTTGNLCSRYAEITNLVQTAISGAAAQTLSFSISEQNTNVTDGVGLLVLFDDPAGTRTSFVLFAGAQNPTGDDFALRLPKPWDTSAGKALQMGVAIGFSAGFGQASTITMNGGTISTVAGAYDDGALANGALYTLGTPDDTPCAIPCSAEANDHEIYNLDTVITNTATLLNFHTVNPSNDDAIHAVWFASNVDFSLPSNKPTLAKSFTPSTIGAGITSTLSITILNDITNSAQTGLGFTDNFTTGLTVADTITNNTCNGTLTNGSGNALSVGDTSIKLTNGSMSSGMPSCTLSVNVIASVGRYTNGAANISDVAILALSRLVTQTLTVLDIPDLSIAISQPNPDLIAEIASSLTVTITNQGSLLITDPLTATLTLPAGISTSASFSSNDWTCTTVGQTVTCTSTTALPGSSDSLLIIPVTAAASTINTTPGPFIASLAAVAGEANTVNNGPINMTLNVAVDVDTDGDGVGNIADQDDDDDGILDSDEGDGTLDTDGDNVPNSLDLDSDNDGINDVREAGELVDANGDGKADDLPTVNVSASSVRALIDTDGDGKPDGADLDSDGDGLSDLFESGIAGLLDEDHNGVVDGSDLDNDGIPDSADGLNGQGDNNDPELVNTDGTGGPNYLDSDSDDDGKSDQVEGTSDVDGDGIPNYIDSIDSDGPLGDPDSDGLTNAQETTIGTNPNNPDSDGDGISDTIEVGPNSASPLDTDGDDIPNALDPDSDNDGRSDQSERTLDSDSDGIPDYLDFDDDGDGVLTKNEDLNKDGDPTNDDTDGDGIPNYLDTDDNGNGILTKDEDTNHDGILENDDSDGNGIPDYLDITVAKSHDYWLPLIKSVDR
ncbi:hypothetical protein BH10CHL1_BH10CHL1_30740 [soil metagenome]